MNEVELYGSLLKSLRQATVSSLGSSDKAYREVGVTYLDYTVTGYYDDWNSILDYPSNNSFIIPIRDATYGLPIIPEGTDLSISPETYAVVTGVIHTETMQTAYSEVSVGILNYVTGAVLGTISFEENRNLNGSALRYLDTKSPLVMDAAASGADPSNLYAVDIRAPGACKKKRLHSAWSSTRNTSDTRLLP